MQWYTVPPEKITVSERHCLKPEMAVLIGAFVQDRVVSAGGKDCIEIRIAVSRGYNAGMWDAETLHINGFTTLLLDVMNVNVTASAKDLLRNYGEGYVVDYRSNNLCAILSSELQEVRFDLDLSKDICSLWFRCIKTQPVAIIPRTVRANYFIPMMRTS
jgi:hypothetical protein